MKRKEVCVIGLGFVGAASSVAISNGVDLYTVGQLLGHTQTQTTARYAHLFDETLHRATETVAEVMTTNTRA